MDLKHDGVIALTFASHPFYSVLSLILALCKGIFLPVSVMLIQSVIDSTLLLHQDQAFEHLVILGLVLGAGSISSNLDYYLKMKIQNDANIKLGKVLLQKSGNIDYQYYENSDSYSLMQRVMGQYQLAITSIVIAISTSISCLIMALGLFVYLMQVYWWILPVLVLTIVPSLYFSIKLSLIDNNSFNQYYPYLAKAEYLSSLITSRRSIKEARLFQFGRFVEKKWEDYLTKFHVAQVKANSGQSINLGISVFIQYVVVAINLIYLYLQVIHKNISLGVFIAVANVIWSFIGDIQFSIIAIIKNTASYVRFVSDFTTFMKFTESDVTKDLIPMTSFTKIELIDIWYRYESGAEDVLRGINFTIDCGQRIGIVGQNGSGKSTLVKIILGLISPTKGHIILDGIIITKSNQFLLTRVASSIFQDYTHFNLSLKDSLTLGSSVSSKDAVANLKKYASLDASSFLLNSLKQNTITMLGKDRWNGQDLSGGQWQTISLIRTLCANRPLLILDEPTSSLDPQKEVEVYSQIYSTREANTIIIVTHRLGGIVAADTIFLLDNGIIAESGEHTHLIKKAGLYAEMFDSQKQWYSK